MSQSRSEVTVINRQKFLAELAKLLTFMYEEDRQTALSLYEELFRDCEDEQKLLQFLVSPTRQAVVLARAYNAKEHMLSVQTQNRRDEFYDDEETPAYIAAIEEICADARRRFGRIIPDISRPQAFAPVSAPARPDPAEQEEEEAPAPFAVADHIPEEDLPLLQEEGVEEEDEPFPVSAETVPDEEYSVLNELDYQDDPQEELITEEFEPDKRHYAHPDPGAHRKCIVPLLILFLIPAVPITLLLLLLLLVPTLLALGLSAGSIFSGLVLLLSAFGSFAMLADILVVFGAGIIFLALGFLFLWIFVWLIGGVMAGLVNNVMQLGTAFSTKEVAAE